MKQSTLDKVSPTTSADRMALLRAKIAPIRNLVDDHPLYGSICTMEGLHTFLESHVFAVWDFMSLLKALQQVFTCVTIPWLPSRWSECRRLINEIVLGEESDEFGSVHVSHFELYLLAMREAGAKTDRVESFLDELHNGNNVRCALLAAGVPDEAARFVESTFLTIRESEPHVIAAAFTFGREDLIPDMFRSIVSDLNHAFPGRLGTLMYYLERHIDVDGDTHGPMALRMISDLCADDEQRWSEAAQAAIHALEARLVLWTAVHDRITSNHKFGPLLGQAVSKVHMPGRPAENLG